MPEHHAELAVINRLGLHARAAAKVVSIASRLDASIQVSHRGRQVDAKSIMGLLTLAAGQGSRLSVRVTGPEADQALRELQELFERRFDEAE